MTTVMIKISKSQFKARALEYFRQVESTGREIIITDRGEPTLKIVPFREEPSVILELIRESVIEYNRPLDPVGEEEWEVSLEKEVD